ncbi:nitrogen fixation protein [Xanthobacter agilis]|jgi:nitrogen fixation protein NifX|uniref:nitrogen fixation protein n=1 Tax=Xanthobacter agilis TaxID=47492 RepID=UPI003726B09F
MDPETQTPTLRIAVTTDSLIQLDANFAAAKQVVFYDVTPKGSEFVDVVHFQRRAKGKASGGGKAANGGRCIMDDMGDDDGTGRDPLVERVEALDGCAVLFTLGLSDVAAVRVHDLKVFPVKSERVRDIDDVIAQVQRLMTGVPPLWIRRALNRRSGSAEEDLQEY